LLGLFSYFRFRTRLALILLLVLAVTCGVLFATYLGQNRRIKAYVAGITSDLVAISQVTLTRLPPNSTRTQALEQYMTALKHAGLSGITVATPAGEVVASTNDSLVGKKIKFLRHHPTVKPSPVKISAEFPETNADVNVGEKAYVVEFPIVQGDKVIGYARVRGFGDQFDALLRRTDLVRSLWILVTLVLGTFAMVYLAFVFTKPVDLLVDGAQQVAQGNLYVSLPVKGRDEIGRLSQTFNQMVGRLRENKQLQERLSEAEKTALLGRFAGSVAHEVRNSLNFINLSIDQARAKQSALLVSGAVSNGERSAREVQRNLTNVKEEVARLNHLVTDFLAAGRQSPPKLDSCDVRDTLSGAVSLVEKQAHTQGVRIHTALPAGLPKIQADRQQLKTCFLNILTNAVQAMPDGGEIAVSGSYRADESGGGRIEMSFADTGPGIPVKDRERVFAPFYSTKATGFGLGLAITRKIVEDHGGRIYVQEVEFPGTVMIVELPQSSILATPAGATPPFPAAARS
jgi:signal transduction histidine kinase